MAAEDWFYHWDGVEDWADREVSAPFVSKCKWCRGYITMHPVEDGWKPHDSKGVHFCKARAKHEERRALDDLPDLSTPECQFCRTNMVWQEVNDEDWWGPKWHLYCPDCGSNGPIVDEKP